MVLPTAAAPVPGTDPAMAKLIQMIIAQQQAFQQLLAAVKAERKTALEHEEKRLAEIVAK